MIFFVAGAQSFKKKNLPDVWHRCHWMFYLSQIVQFVELDGNMMNCRQLLGLDLEG